MKTLIQPSGSCVNYTIVPVHRRKLFRAAGGRRQTLFVEGYFCDSFLECYYPDAVIIIITPMHLKTLYAECADDGRNNAVLPYHQHEPFFTPYFFCQSGCIHFTVSAVYFEIIFCCKWNHRLKHPCVAG